MERQQQFRKLFSYYPDVGALRRELYPKHFQFFAAGARHEPLPSCPPDCDGSPHRDRLALAGNRTGKTEGMGGYETALHLTGLYPHWWPGLKFDRPIDAWASGRRNEGTRDIVQAKLFGSVLWRGREKGLSGTGLIPKDNIGHVTWKRGIADFVDTVQIKHKAGGWSQIGLKSYEQGQSAFQGTEKDLIWLDEEPPMLVYVECGVRLMTRAGHLLMTFTPELGMTEVVQEFWNGNVMRGASTV